MEISFTYIITFISLIYGLALAHSLSCISEYIQHWKQIKHYWVWWFWAMYLLLLSVGFWWSIYAMWNQTEVWEITDFVFLTAQSSLFYLTFYIFFNHFNELENNNLEFEYYKYKNIFFILLPIQFILMFVGHSFLATEKSMTEILLENMPIFPQIIILIILAVTNNKIVHGFFAVVFILLFIVAILLLSYL